MERERAVTRPGSRPGDGTARGEGVSGDTAALHELEGATREPAVAPGKARCDARCVNPDMAACLTLDGPVDPVLHTFLLERIRIINSHLDDCQFPNNWTSVPPPGETFQPQLFFRSENIEKNQSNIFEYEQDPTLLCGHHRSVASRSISSLEGHGHSDHGEVFISLFQKTTALDPASWM